MRGLLHQKALAMDRAVLLFIVAVNAAFLAKFEVSANVLIGLVNGSLAGTLLAASIWWPNVYAMHRQLPIMLLRLLVAALPLVSDTVGPFAKSVASGSSSAGSSDASVAAAAAWWHLGRATFMLVVSISWAVGLFTATFLLLPPAQHLAVQAVSLALLLNNNSLVCENFLQQHPSNGAVIDAIDAVLRALTMSLAPAVQQEVTALSRTSTQHGNCMAASAAFQVSLGLVLPTMLAWQLQSRMVESIADHAAARQDSRLAAQVRRSQHATLCAALTRATQGITAKLLATGGSMLVTYVACLLLNT